MEQAAGRRALKVVLTAMASDAHTWNLVYLQLLLEGWGNSVTNLGPCVPDDLLLQTCRTAQPDLLVVSSVNGHGYAEGLRVIGRLRACPQLLRLPVVIGGKLGTNGENQAGQSEALNTAGFDLVVPEKDGIEPFRQYVDALAQGVRC